MKKDPQQPIPVIPWTPNDSHTRQLVEGVVITAQSLVHPPGSPERTDLEGQWDNYEVRLRNSNAPLARLIHRLGLNRFELKTLHVLLGMHCDPNMAQLIAQVDEQPLEVGVTVRTVVKHLLWDAASRLEARRSFLPGSSLVDRHIITLGVLAGHSEDGLYDRPLLMTGPAIRYCLGEPAMPRIRTGLYTIDRPTESLLDVVLGPERLEAVRRLLHQHQRRRSLSGPWGTDTTGSKLRILLSGPPGTGKTMLSRALANSADSPLLTLNASQLPTQAGLEEALRDAFTDAWLIGAVVSLSSCDAALGRDDPRREIVLDALDNFDGIVMLQTNRAKQLDPSLERRITYHLTFALPDVNMRLQLWEVHLPPELPVEADLDLTTLAARYDFCGATIRNAVLCAVNQALAVPNGQPVLTTALLEAGCRAQLPANHDALTVDERGHHMLVDIVLPEKPRRIVVDLLSACRNQTTVLSTWGFGRKLATGKGIVALFDGPPGTGKTFCAEIIASELGRLLQRVNVAELVSKWVGETEKHVHRVFQQARISHAILLFDEADALFSARSADSGSSGDRHSNTVVNLLLQEIERFPGVCVLTTNFFGALDKALLRRVQFRVTFEEPDAPQRQQLWEALCPPEAPRGPDIDFRKLARSFELTGGMIKNALLRAAYRACDAGDPLTMAHLQRACLDEYAAVGKVIRSRKEPARRPTGGAA